MFYQFRQSKELPEELAASAGESGVLKKNAGGNGSAERSKKVDRISEKGAEYKPCAQKSDDAGMPAPRPAIQALEAYVPGEQPKIPGLIKLNTNENPYPPAPEVIETARREASESMRIYPDPMSTALCEEAARLCGVEPDQVIFANGSDEILRMICMAWLDAGEEAAMLWPTYSLYDTFVGMFGGRVRHIAAQAGAALPMPGDEGFSPASESKVAASKSQAAASESQAPRVFFLANPNPPYGTLYALDEVERLARALPRTLVVLDEAYVDFAPAGASGLPLLARCPNLIVTRTFSKSYSLAGMRLGFGVANRDLIAVLRKVKDSYNLDRVSQAAGLAALRAREAFDRAVAAINRERERLAGELRAIGFDVPESAANFIFPRRGPIEARAWFTGLRERRILVRYFTTPELRDGVRISIGTPQQMDALIQATKEMAEKK